MAENATDTLDSISALDREDVERAIVEIRAMAGMNSRRPLPHLSRLADALAEHLIDRHDA